MPLFPALLASRQLETTRPNRARERRYPDRFARCYRDPVPKADQDRQSATLRQGSRFDGGQCWACGPWPFQVVVHVQHHKRELDSLRLQRERHPPQAAAACHGRPPIPHVARVIPWHRWAVLQTPLPGRLQHTHFLYLLDRAKQPSVGVRHVTGHPPLTIAQHVRRLQNPRPPPERPL